MVLTTGGPTGVRLFRPGTKVVLGLAVVFVAVRVDGFDVLLNPVGWAVCASSLARLGSAGDLFSRAAAFALGMVCLSTVALYASGVRASLGAGASPVIQLIGLAENVASLVGLWLVAEAVVRRLRLADRPAAALDVLRWALAGLGVLDLLDDFGHVEPGPVVPVAWGAGFLALLVMLHRTIDRPYA
ncbi:hypothetical protein [Nonomuraea sp. NPDC048826]|uniref:hypothetical protein n=1 Tax=Nonomuraea sp. NPDC048826 TaxID=3364347 RepID=UPI00371105FC